METNMSKIQTIKLKNKNYAPVSERVKAVHEDYKDVSIETGYEFKEGWAICKATINISSTEKNGKWTGHSMGKANGEKAFEKLETVAVGRALAFAGYLAGGEIASYDEMEKFQDDNDGKNGDGLDEKISRVNSEAIVKDIGDCVKLKEVKKLWGGLNTYQKQHPDVNDAKDIKKEELSK